jgi:hypothetical protein
MSIERGRGSSPSPNCRKSQNPKRVRKLQLLPKHQNTHRRRSGPITALDAFWRSISIDPSLPPKILSTLSQQLWPITTIGLRSGTRKCIHCATTKPDCQRDRCGPRGSWQSTITAAMGLRCAPNRLRISNEHSHNGKHFDETSNDWSETNLITTGLIARRLWRRIGHQVITRQQKAVRVVWQQWTRTVVKTKLPTTQAIHLVRETTYDICMATDQLPQNHLKYIIHRCNCLRQRFTSCHRRGTRTTIRFESYMYRGTNN